jgi:murein DD-endopeptidase MepM/ murein hydrolase activator NlpD
MVAMLPVPSAHAATDPLAAAEARITEAQVAADRAAAEYDAAQARSSQLADDVARTRAEIESLKGQQERLAAIARDRAIRAYKGGLGEGLDAFITSSDDALEAARRAELLDRANERGNQAIDRLQATTDDLTEQEKSLRAQLDEQQTVVAELEANQEELQAALRDATRAADELRAELERRRRADEYAQFVRKAREAARAQANAAENRSPLPLAASGASSSSDDGNNDSGSGGDSGGGGAGQILGSGDWICPVQGPVSFTDTYGAPRGGGRTHKGVDMFAARGTPVVAVTAGSVWYQSDPAGGNAAYVDAADGNTYYYAHLTQYVGGNRGVSGGEVIGTVGNTGTSSAPPHLHFEIRVGGANGNRINPYPTVAAHC